MENVSLVISFAFVILFGYFLARMSWSIGANLVQGRQLRRGLRNRLMALPLEQALERAGVDPDLYLHERPLHEVDRHLRNCGSCGAARECQSALATATPIDEFMFCPNYATLLRSSDKAVQ